MTGSRSYYVTTPIYYVNDRPHIGHAYTTLACDVLARFKRLDGYRVMFLTGTDEHGQKVEKSAHAKGIDPQVFTDEVSQNFRDLASVMKYSHDDFIRTTEPRHKAACAALWKRLVDRGDIYAGKYAGWYAVRDEAFYAESELQTAPDGTRIAPTGAPVEWVEEPSYFFRLSAWQDKLLRFYDEHPDFIAPESRRNEVISFVQGGLQDLSVSRTTFRWGVPVPGDSEHIMYVWLDALTNYLTATGYPDTGHERYKAFWPADLHMVGKDILRFHAVYWPAFLMAADLPLPKRVFAHGWWTNEGQKISKSLGNVIDPYELVGTFGLDQTRYFLLREVPFGNDGVFSRQAFVRRMNTELANDLGNLVQRTLSMIAKNCSGKVPEVGVLEDSDRHMLDSAYSLLDVLREQLDRQAFHEALESIWVVVRAANAYVDHQAPWSLRKTDPKRMETVLWVLAESIRQVALLMQAFVPDGAGRILDQLGLGQEQRGFDTFGPRFALVTGSDLPAPQGIFPRYAEEEVVRS
ncbi:methionine--tRNA ligase [Haematospirillum jordaniae]|uniref:Methionine--tRNA ligase n=1 Tax=Haematospirillum jordaniae TaxID=1549855 RepID=A0A143DF39_9PROT|nr:methionine--tRNA ligase [Haematospirillum jordaniae]AMW35199.1 methionine--tRNA ligase [Haematospirillum jordaniae]NKD45650.1 methionine--tRNA ligase [Haematospirillum jordaniae]NKD56403.1 methionine--tRNA ligase [Haematospirillum jordaniae]NKD58461.1 methionine--tRNA ligase [Haematospirillum jordaniae]NKD66370.1 methionine--tRNA ligase [Haematospirillum jordaniae]